MAENSKIQWTHHTFNPWSGCSKVHAGCTHCYAEVNYSVKMRGVKWGPNGTRVKTANWSEPLKWNRAAEKAGERHRVFCASLADVFEDWQGPILDHHGNQLWHNGNGRYEAAEHSYYAAVTMDDLRRDLFALIDATPNLDWLLLTKRPENIVRMWQPISREIWGKRYQDTNAFDPEWQPTKEQRSGLYRPNVWLGTSISDQPTADKFAPELLACRDLSPVLFLSAEPLLGPVNAFDYLRGNSYQQWANGGGPNQCRHGIAAGLRCNDCSHIDWVIVGGESGGHARACNAEWIESLVTQCRDAAVPCFVKQLGSNHWGESPECGFARVPLEDSKGGDWDEWPESWRVRQFPVEAT